MTGQVFAIGLGTADQLNPAALDDLVSGTGGFLLLTGNPGLDDQILLKKYFAQILAGVTNGVIVVDPDGFVPLDGEAIVPYDLTSADSRSDVIVLGDAANLLTVLLEAPDGSTLDGSSGADLVLTEQYQTLRVALPSPVVAGSNAGTWRAHLKVNKRRTRRRLEELKKRKQKEMVARLESHGIPFALTVQARSSLRLRVSVAQSSRRPGSDRDAHGDAHRVGDPAREERKRYRCDLGSRRELLGAVPRRGRRRRVPRVDTHDCGWCSPRARASGGHQPARRAIHT